MTPPPGSGLLRRPHQQQEAMMDWVIYANGSGPEMLHLATIRGAGPPPAAGTTISIYADRIREYKPGDFPEDEKRRGVWRVVDTDVRLELSHRLDADKAWVLVDVEPHPHCPERGARVPRRDS